jgi:hypothetical protein
LRMRRTEAAATCARDALEAARFHLALAEGENWVLRYGGSASLIQGLGSAVEGVEHLRAEVAFLQHVTVVETALKIRVRVPSISVPMDRAFAALLADLVTTGSGVLRSHLVSARWSANGPRQISTILGGDFSGKFLVEADVQMITVADQDVHLPFGVRQSLRAEFVDPDLLATYAKRSDSEETDIGLRVLDGEILYTRDDAIEVSRKAGPARASTGVPDAPAGVSAGVVMGDSAITPI